MIERRRAIFSKPKPYIPDYVRLTALESGTFTFKMPYRLANNRMSYIEYSIDEGETWVRTNYKESWDIQATTPTVSAGDSVLWRGIGNACGSALPSGSGITYCASFSSSCRFSVSGNILTLLSGDSKLKQPNKLYAFAGLFWQSKVTDASGLILPSSIAVDFQYADMFYKCTSLTAPPILPATSLRDSCYREMFQGCTSLTTAPELPATTGAVRCYNMMFSGCSNLSYIKAMLRSVPSDGLDGWVYGVRASGTFVKNSAATWDVTGASGVPSGWTIEYASEQ